MRPVLLGALVALSLPTAAFAKVEFVSYEGPDAIQTGQGGAKVTKNGIDWWTSGSPPRRYRIIGIVSDSRLDRLFDGRAVGSGKIAKMVLTAGGHAVIVVEANSRVAGLAGFAEDGAFGGRTINRNTTRMLAISYLP